MMLIHWCFLGTLQERHSRPPTPPTVLDLNKRVLIQDTSEVTIIVKLNHAAFPVMYQNLEFDTAFPVVI